MEEPEWIRDSLEDRVPRYFKIKDGKLDTCSVKDAYFGMSAHIDKNGTLHDGNGSYDLKTWEETDE